jgi:hypothetical protein
MNVNLNVNNKNQECKIGTVCACCWGGQYCREGGGRRKENKVMEYV